MPRQYPLFRPSKRLKVPMVVAIRVIMWRRGRVLLLKRAAHGRDADKWELPGGKLEEGEFFHPALKREVKQETGFLVSPRSLNLYTAVSNRSSSGEYLEIVLECSEPPSGRPKISPEHSKFRWVTVDEALRSARLDLTVGAREVFERLLE